MLEAGAALAQFEGHVECRGFAEASTISICKDGLIASSSFDQLVMPYESISSIRFESYVIGLETSFGPVSLSRLGRQAEWLYDKLFSAYNDAVVAAFKVKGGCLFEAKAHLAFAEGGRDSSCAGFVRIYEDCVCLLAPNELSRRVPLCFLTGIVKDDFSRSLELATGERYLISRMGRELENFDRVLAQKLRALRENTLAWHAALAPSLDPMQAMASARLLPVGRSALIDELSAAAPALLAGIESKLGSSRVAAYYPWFQRLSAGAPYALGAMPGDEGDEDDGVPESLPQALVQAGEVTDEAGSQEELVDEGDAAQDDGVFWLVAPVDGGSMAAVELALPDGEAAATYLYRVSGSWRDFVMLVDRALEAASFKRSPILLSDDQLKEHRHAFEALLVARTPSLKTLRACFVGRAVHSSEQRWLNDISKAKSQLGR